MPSADSLVPKPHIVRCGQGLPLIAIHGNAVDHRILLPLDPILDAAGGIERIYLDLPGFGKTSALAGVGGLPEIADWLVDQVTSLVGTNPFAVLGNSMGGLLARHVRRALPDQVVGMALIAPVVDPDHAHRTLPELVVCERDEALLATLPEGDRDAFTGMAARQTGDTWAAFNRYVLPGLQAGDAHAMERLDQRYFLKTLPEADIAPFGGPMLVLTGRQDNVVGWQDQYRLVEQSYPTATFAALHGAGHNVHLDQPQISSALLGQWAARLPH